MNLWRYALALGYPHPDLMLAELSIPQYHELVAFLQITRWHDLQEWRDWTAAYQCFTTTRLAGVKLPLKSFMPPGEDAAAVETKQTIEQQEAILRAWVAMYPKNESPPT